MLAGRNVNHILGLDYQNAPYHIDRCMDGKVVPLRSAKAPVGGPNPSAAQLEARIHELSKNTSNLRFDHPHFRIRMIQRGITMRQVLEVLRHGNVVDGPKKDHWGDWRVKLQRKVAGRRVQVVVAVQKGRLDLVTTI